MIGVTTLAQIHGSYFKR